MFKCMVTGDYSKPGEKLNRIVVRTREMLYTQNVWEEGEMIEIEIGKGFEIAKEINATDRGVKIWEDASEEERQKILSQKL